MRIPRRLKPLHPMGLRLNDQVVVLNGDDRGKRGRVIRVVSRRDQVVVEGVNMIVKHRKAARQRTAAQLQQGRIQMPAPIDRSNVMLICPRCGKPAKVTMVDEGDGRVRACKKCKAIVDSG